MFGFFKKKKPDAEPEQVADIPHLSDAKQKLMAQMREKRAEIGEEELAKMAHAIQMDNLKKKIKHDIETDEDKRNRLLDEIRLGLKDR